MSLLLKLLAALLIYLIVLVPESLSAKRLLSLQALGLLAFFLLAQLTSIIFGWVVRKQMQIRLAERARRKVQERNALRFRLAGEELDWSGVLAYAEHKFVSLEPHLVVQASAHSLLHMLRTGQLSSVYVTRCFIGRAMAAGAALNCNAEEIFSQALAEAAKCDAKLAAGKLCGPLHGLPVSIKDQFDMAGYDSTLGMACRVGSPAHEDATLVKLLRQAGAIPFIRTAVPQLLMAPETFSFWGVALNPWDKSRTPGGSSGGEAALIAAFGSPLGLGTDIGGSIRIPASYCGLCGFKPTSGRLSMTGVAVARKERGNGQKEIRSSAGPMGRTVNDLELMMRVLCSPADQNGLTRKPGEPLRCKHVQNTSRDVTVPPVPWDCETYIRATGLSRLIAASPPAALAQLNNTPSSTPKLMLRRDGSNRGISLFTAEARLGKTVHNIPSNRSSDAQVDDRSSHTSSSHSSPRSSQTPSPPLGGTGLQVPRAPQTLAQGAFYESSSAYPPVKVRVGVIRDDGWFEPAPACLRAVNEAADALRTAGHEVVNFHLNGELRATVLAYISLLSADGKFRSFVEALEGEQLHQNYSFLYRTAQTPNALRPLLGHVLRRLGEVRKAELVLAARQKTAYEYWQAIVIRDKLRESFLRRLREENIDVLLTPANALPAVQHGTSTLLAQACSYSFAFNCLDMPAGVLPVTRVRISEQTYIPSRDANDSFSIAARKVCAGSAGLPVCVQLVGLPWQDEVTLGALRALEYALRITSSGKTSLDERPPHPPLPLSNPRHSKGEAVVAQTGRSSRSKSTTRVASVTKPSAHGSFHRRGGNPIS